MAFSGRVYANVAGATTAVAGQTVQSAVWDNIHSDYGTALTQLMSQLITMTSFRNILWMNGGFEVWQRGAGSSASIALAASSTAYMADRWYLTTGANEASVVSAQTGLTSQSLLCARVRRNAAQTGTTVMTFGYPLDTDEIALMRNKLVSFSCSVQAGANWSPTSGTLTVALYAGTGAVGKRGGGFTSETTVFTTSVNITAGGSVTSISVSSSVVLPANSTQAELQFTWTPTGTAGAADDISIDDCELEPQNSATTWTPCSYDILPFAIMLAGCKRHYQKTFLYSVAPAQAAGAANALSAVAIATQRLWVNWEYPIEMRTTGTCTTYIPLTGSSANWYDYNASTSVAVSVDTTAAGTKNRFLYSTTSGSTTNDICYIQADNDAGI